MVYGVTYVYQPFATTFHDLMSVSRVNKQLIVISRISPTLDCIFFSPYCVGTHADI